MLSITSLFACKERQGRRLAVIDQGIDLGDQFHILKVDMPTGRHIPRHFDSTLKPALKLCVKALVDAGEDPQKTSPWSTISVGKREYQVKDMRPGIEVRKKGQLFWFFVQLPKWPSAKDRVYLKCWIKDEKGDLLQRLQASAHKLSRSFSEKEGQKKMTEETREISNKQDGDTKDTNVILDEIRETVFELGEIDVGHYVTLDDILNSLRPNHPELTEDEVLSCLQTLVFSKEVEQETYYNVTYFRSSGIGPIRLQYAEAYFAQLLYLRLSKTDGDFDNRSQIADIMNVSMSAIYSLLFKIKEKGMIEKIEPDNRYVFDDKITEVLVVSGRTLTGGDPYKLPPQIGTGIGQISREVADKIELYINSKEEDEVEDVELDATTEGNIETEAMTESRIQDQSNNLKEQAVVLLEKLKESTPGLSELLEINRKDQELSLHQEELLQRRKDLVGRQEEIKQQIASLVAEVEEIGQMEQKILRSLDGVKVTREAYKEEREDFMKEPKILACVQMMQVVETLGEGSE